MGNGRLALPQNDGPDGFMGFVGQYERQGRSLTHCPGSLGKSTLHDRTFLNSDRASHKHAYQCDSKDCCAPMLRYVALHLPAHQRITHGTVPNPGKRGLSWSEWKRAAKARQPGRQVTDREHGQVDVLRDQQTWPLR
jgi:hypothetical protein